MCRRAPLRRNRHWPSYIQQGSSATNIEHGGHATYKNTVVARRQGRRAIRAIQHRKVEAGTMRTRNQVAFGDKGTYCSTPRIVLLLPTAQHNTRFCPSKLPSGLSSPSTSSTSPVDKLPPSLLSPPCPCPLRSSLASRPAFLARS